MKAICLFLLLWVWSFEHCAAQITFSPGGVKGPIIWYQTDSTAVPAYHSLIGKDSIIFIKNAPPNAHMNFHPALVFKGGDTLAIPLPDSSLENATFFTAYHNKAINSEGVVWHITKQNKTTVVFTTSRLADLETYKYMNYRDFVLSQPKIAAYIQQKPKDATFPLHQSWNIGFKPHSPALPVFSFDGVVPEVIAYERVLSTEERLKVGSYLAIKYGITLSDPGATYLNSKGDIIWNGPAYTNYHHNITGIARDDSSRLMQLQSTSSNAPGLLTLSAKKQLGNYAALIWGDNDKPLSQADKIRGMPTLLKKQWLMFTSNNGQPLATDLTVDTKSFDMPLPANPIYWLVIDRSGKGEFSAGDIEFVRMTTLEENGKAHFSEVAWGLQNNNKEVACFAVAQDLLAHITVTDPVCTDASGSIDVKIIGGQAPFEIKLADEGGKIVCQRTISDDKTVNIGGLGAEKYQCTITDAAKTMYTDLFFLNGTESPKPPSVASNYMLPPSGILTISADSGMVAGLQYEWDGPGGFHSRNPQVSITQPGNYRLKCGNGDCTHQQDVIVSGFPSGALTENNIIIYPNPSKGAFTASVSLDKPAPVEMAIFAVDGARRGKPQSASGKANYQFQGTISGAGVYMLQFSSGKYLIGKKIIIIN